MPNRCRLCPSHKLPIEGEGPVPARVAFFGEAPGRTEDHVRDEAGRGRPFHGDAGQELNRVYLKLAGLKREEVYVSNCVKCLPGNDEVVPPGDNLARCCSQQWVAGELRRVQPEVVVTLGVVAYKTLFPNYPSIDVQHGVPIRANYRDWSGYVIPMWHPAAALRQPGVYMTQLSEDFRNLGELLRAGEITAPEDEFPEVIYEECQTADDVYGYFSDNDTYPATKVAIDTETVVKDGGLFCLSASAYPGTAIVIRRDRQAAVEAFSRVMNDSRWSAIYHHSAFDIPVLQRAGVATPERYIDTMVYAYEIGMQQGLKALAWRLCGMAMDDFDDVARPYSVAVFRQWLMKGVLTMNELLAPAVPSTSGSVIPANLQPPAWSGLPKSKRGKMYREWLAEVADQDALGSYRGCEVCDYGAGYAEHFCKVVNAAKLGIEKQALKSRNLLKSIQEEGNMDPWDRLDGWEDNTAALLESYVGPPPRLSIVHVPWEQAMHYSARDADATLRVYHQLRRRLSGKHHRHGISV